MIASTISINEKRVKYLLVIKIFKNKVRNESFFLFEADDCLFIN